MPSVKRGFVFKYFDKLICGLVALALLAGVVYAFSHAGAVPQQIQPQNVNHLASTIKERLQAPAQPLSADLPSLAALNEVAPPPSMRPHMMIWPLPVQYAPIRVGLDKDFVLQFKAPLGVGTISVQTPDGSAPPVKVVEHPVDGDYSKVKLHSLGYVGSSGTASCTVVGYEGRIAHIYPVIVDQSVNGTAYAPTELTAVSQHGTATLKIVEDPRIAKEGVKIAYYEIWRRDWSDDPLGKYELVDGVTPSGQSLSGGKSSGTRRSTMAAPTAMGGFGAAGMAGAAGGSKAEEQPGISYTDNTVQAGERYSYKVRAIGLNTFPTEGKFSKPVMVQVLGDIDFRLTFSTPSSVQFEVVTASGDAGATSQRFWESPGDAIGGVKDSVSYLPGYALVDFQPDATQANKPGLPGRAIYADDKGNLREIWSGETNAPDLWKQLKAAATTTPMRPLNVPGRGRNPFGYNVPRPGMPYGRPGRTPRGGLGQRRRG